MITYLFTISMLLHTAITDLKEVVKEYHQLKGETEESNFINKYINSTDPSILGYVASIGMKQAEYSINPYYKLKVFLTYKKKLDQLINQHTNNIHLRYVRLVVQENVPAILKNYEEIKEDKIFLKNKLESTDDTDYLDAYIKINTSL